MFFGSSCQVRTANGNFTFDGDISLFAELEESLRGAGQDRSTIFTAINTHLGDEIATDKLLTFLISKGVIVKAIEIENASEYEVLNYSKFMLYPDDDMIRASKSCSKITVVKASPFFEQITSGLSESGFEVENDCKKSDLSIFMGCNASHNEILDINATLFATGKPYLLGNIEGYTVNIGPLVFPGKTACYQCLHRRLYANALSQREFLALTHFKNTNSLHSDPAVSGFVCSIILNEMKKYKYGNLQAVPTSARIEIDLGDYSSERRQIIKVPRCPTCSSLSQKPTPALRDAV